MPIELPGLENLEPTTILDYLSRVGGWIQREDNLFHHVKDRSVEMNIPQKGDVPAMMAVIEQISFVENRRMFHVLQDLQGKESDNSRILRCLEECSEAALEYDEGEDYISLTCDNGIIHFEFDQGKLVTIHIDEGDQEENQGEVEDNDDEDEEELLS